MDAYKATYNPHHHVPQPPMFNVHPDAPLDQLQREFLESTQREFEGFILLNVHENGDDNSG